MPSATKPGPIQPSPSFSGTYYQPLIKLNPFIFGAEIEFSHMKPETDVIHWISKGRTKGGAGTSTHTLEKLTI